MSASMVMLVPSALTSRAVKPAMLYGLLPAFRSACAIQSSEKRTSSSTVASSSCVLYTCCSCVASMTVPPSTAAMIAAAIMNSITVNPRWSFITSSG